MSAGGYVQVLSGLAEGETIVTSSQFLLDSESNLKVAIGQMSGGKLKKTSPHHPAFRPLLFPLPVGEGRGRRGEVATKK